ncbi:MAG: hypothetical protein V3U80_01045 [Flavobacteriaceae bacterium]
MQNSKLVKLLLLSGAIYFFTVAIVHFLGLKIPMLYVYFDVESTVYQDRIISALSAMFAVFLFSGYKLIDVTTDILKYILIAGAIGIFGLSLNNFLTNTTFRENPIYWLEISLLGLYVVSLLFLYRKLK